MNNSIEKITNGAKEVAQGVAEGTKSLADEATKSAKILASKDGVKSFTKEFSEFAFKGNLADVAIGFVMGAAFREVVNAFIDFLISPILGLFFNRNFSLLTFTIGRVVFPIGNFITALITFVLTAFVLFLFVKAMNKKRRDTPIEEQPVREDIELLREIRDSLQKTKKTADSK